MKALILNDTRKGNHVGCIIVMQRLVEECKFAGIEITGMLPLGRNLKATAQREIEQCDTVIINGEGTMHHDATGALRIVEVAEFASQRGIPVALINTVWQDNIKANRMLPHCKWIATRESISQEAISNEGFNAKVIPDLTLTSDPSTLFAETKYNGKIVIMDDVRPEISLILARYAKQRNLPFYPMGPRPTLRPSKSLVNWFRMGMASGWASQFHIEQLSAIKQAPLVVTGRFHGICLAILAKRPFVAFASNTYKIEGLLKDANLGQGGRLFQDPPHNQETSNVYLDETIQQVSEYMQCQTNKLAFEKACEAYLTSARMSAKMMFKEIVANVSK